MKNNPLKIYRERYITKANFSNSYSNFLSGTFPVPPLLRKVHGLPKAGKSFFLQKNH
jgi:hypothetical protein